MTNARWVVILMAVALVATGCKKDKGDAAGAGSGTATATTGSAAGSAAGSADETVPAVSCQDASKVYAKLMAASPGNPLSDMKPSNGVVHLFAVTIEEGCDSMWSPKSRACVAGLTSAAAVPTCFTPQEAADLDAGVAFIVEEFKTNKAANDKAAAEAAGSGSGSAGP